MAGGKGTRFWPASRQNYPKQFNDILGTDKSLLQQTVDRFKNLCPRENVYVVTNKSYKNIVEDQVPGLSEDQILLEPSQRNTAPCIAYACYKIAHRNPEARIVISPSDHAIFNEKEFEEIIGTSLDEVAGNDNLVTLGIKPTRPDTGYGYIQYLKEDSFLKKVKTFTEKPEWDLAKKFVESGDFVWNAGIFIWNVNAIKKAFKRFLPDVDETFEDISDTFFTAKEQEKIDVAYSHCKNISIDYGIMEKAKNVYVVLGDFGWSDIGSWNSLYEISEKNEDGNVVDGNVLVYDSKNCIIKAPKDKLIIIEGLEDFLIAEYDNATIICRKDHESRFRKFIKDVKDKKGEEYL